MPLDAMRLPGPISPYAGNYASLPQPMLRPPVEGNRAVPISINWLRDGVAPGYTVDFNAQNQRVTPISQISAVFIDNTASTVPVEFLFRDTSFSFSVESGAAGFIPVLTNNTQFFCFTSGAPLPSDHIFVQVLNFLPPALALLAPPGLGGGTGTVSQVDTGTGLTGGPINLQGTIALSTPVAVANGGTGAATAVAARTALGAGTVSEVDTALPLTGGPITGQGAIGLATPLAVSWGGTGAGSAATARLNLGVLPVTGGTLTGPLEIDGSLTFRGNANPALDVVGGFTSLWAPDGIGTTRGIFLGEGAGAPIFHRIDSHQFQASDASVTWAFIDTTGTHNISGSWIAVSAAAAKKEIAPYDRGLDAVALLQPVSFRYNGRYGTADDGHAHLGLIADDLAEIMPELTGARIDPESGDEVRTLSPGLLVYPLINAVRELAERLEALEAAQPHQRARRK